MTIRLNRKDIAAAMALLARIVERRTTIPILGNVRLTLKANDQIEFTANNLDIEARAQVACNSMGMVPGVSTTTPAHMLNDILRKLPDGAEIILDRDWSSPTDRLVLKSGRARFQLQVLPSEDFPDFEVTPFTDRFSLPAVTLLACLKPVAFAISKEETRYYLNGVHLHTQDGKLHFVATDGHRLACKTIDLPGGAADMPPIILPRGAVAEVMRLAEGFTSDVQVEMSSTKLRATFGEMVITTKLIDGTFPDYQRIVPLDNEVKATLKREALADAVARAALVASDKSNGMAFDLAPERLLLEVVNPDVGTASEELDMAFAGGEPFRIGFNAAYVTEILNGLDGDEVEFALKDAGSPTLITTPANPDLLIVLMPMRLSH